MRPSQLATTEEIPAPHGYFVARRERAPTNEIILRLFYCEYKGVRALGGKARWILRAIIGILVAVAAVMAFRYDTRLGIGIVSIVMGLSWLWGPLWKKIERASSMEVNPDAPTTLGDWTVTYRH